MSAGKHFWVKFEHNRWMNEPGLQICSHNAYAVWHKALCQMWSTHKTGTIKATGLQLSFMFRCTVQSLYDALLEIARFDIGQVTINGESVGYNMVTMKPNVTLPALEFETALVTITCRSIEKDYKSSNYNTLKLRRWRENKACNHAVNQNVTSPLREEKRREDINPPVVPLALASESDDPVVLVYPAAGVPAAWHLRQSQIREWVGLYPGLDVETECRNALAWVGANRKKTAGGMKRFLVNWLNKATNSQRTNQQPRRVTQHEIRFESKIAEARKSQAQIERLGQE